MSTKRQSWLMLCAIVLGTAMIGSECPGDPTGGSAQLLSIALYPAGQGPGTTGNPFPTKVFWLDVQSEPQGPVAPCNHNRFDFIDNRVGTIWTLGTGTYTQGTTVAQGTFTSLEFYSGPSMSPNTSCDDVVIGQFRGAGTDFYDLLPGTLVRTVEFLSGTHATRSTVYTFTGTWTSYNGMGGATTGSGSYYIYPGQVQVNPPTALTAAPSIRP